MASPSNNNLDFISMFSQVSLLETETHIQTLTSRITSRTQTIDSLEQLGSINVKHIKYLREENDKDKVVVSSLEEVRDLLEDQKNIYSLLLKN